MAASSGPMLCQTHEGKLIFSLPQKVDCSPSILADLPEKLVPTKVSLYKRNHVQYLSEAWVCKKVKTVVRSLTYFFNDERERTVAKIPISVSPQECHQMRQWHACEVGQMFAKGDLWQTSQEPNWIYPGGGASCCYWKTSQTENCYMYKAYVYKRHIANKMESTAGVVSHCNYESGSCQLKDGSFLLWDVNNKVNCEFLPWKTLDGQRYGANRLSDVGILALTHTTDQWTTDCTGKRISMSDQGIPFVFLNGGHKMTTISKALHRRVK